jgi:rhomboid protease GluP
MKKIWITYILIGLNVLVFGIIALLSNDIKMQSGAAVELIFRFGANFNPLTLNGEPWRIFTCMFLHYGILHIGVNMYSLYNLGMMLESPIGSIRFLLIYLICGIVASLASLTFGAPFVMSAGASGALFGLYGYQLGAQLIISYRDGRKLKPILTNFLIFVVINVMIANSLNVDNSAHIGGCITGLLLSVCHFKFNKLKSEMVLLIILVGLPSLLLVFKNDQYAYYNFYRNVASLEEYEKEHIHSLSTETQDEIMTGWRSLSEALENIEIPKKVAEDKHFFELYLPLREKRAAYIFHYSKGETIYGDSINMVNEQLSSIPELKHPIYFLIEAK